ncbi:MAG TPA: response regulator [Candidatus Acidoferrales bacterium]|nr:response regulator [Candidatus Acidoferrales bacterium]
MERILVIDDDEAILQNVSRALKIEGYQADVANTGKKAIELAESSFYNLALIDLRLPDIEGTELLTSLKNVTPRTVRIILTGFPTLSTAITAVNKNADGYLTKPVKMDELIKTIKEHLVKQSKEDEYDEEKVSEFVESRLRKLETEEDSKK